VVGRLRGLGELSHETPHVASSADDHSVPKLPDVNEVRHDVLAIGFDAPLWGDEHAGIDAAPHVLEDDGVAVSDHVSHLDAALREARPPIVDVVVPPTRTPVDKAERQFDPLRIFGEETCSGIQIVVGDRLE